MTSRPTPPRAPHWRSPKIPGCGGCGSGECASAAPGASSASIRSGSGEASSMTMTRLGGSQARQHAVQAGEVTGGAAMHGDDDVGHAPSIRHADRRTRHAAVDRYRRRRNGIDAGRAARGRGRRGRAARASPRRRRWRCALRRDRAGCPADRARRGPARAAVPAVRPARRATDRKPRGRPRRPHVVDPDADVGGGHASASRGRPRRIGS